MDDRHRQRELDDVDFGTEPQEVLRRTAEATRADRDQAATELNALLSDKEIFEVCGLDMAVLRQGIALDSVWSLP